MKKVLAVIFCLALLAAVVSIYVFFARRQTPKFRVTFLNIGEGDGALIQFDDGEKMMVDCGPNKIVLARLGEVLPFYDRTIDYVLATHPDLDHYGGCVDVLKRYQVKEVIINGRKKINPYWRAWDALIHASGKPIKIIQGHQVWHIGEATLEFFSPDDTLGVKARAADSNNYSIVFRLRNGKQTFLFTGDMEQPLENGLLKRYCADVPPREPCPALRSDVLKAGHHGSDSSSGEDFLAAVHPAEAVISVGPNHYGHPTRRVLRRLERLGIPALRTDQLGNIAVP